jgi:hypothetical protein
MKSVNVIVPVIAVAVGLIASIYISADQAFSIFLVMVGAWLIYLGLSGLQSSIIGVFSVSAVKVGWGGTLVSVSASWLIFRNFSLHWQESLVILLIGLAATLLMAAKVEKRTKKSVGHSINKDYRNIHESGSLSQFHLSETIFRQKTNQSRKTIQTLQQSSLGTAYHFTGQTNNH